MNQTPQAGSEQRLTFRLLSYWNRIRAERKIPSLSDVNIAEILEIWHFSFTIDVRDVEHRFEYFGPSLSDIFQQDYTGFSVQDAMNDDLVVNNTIGFYERAVLSMEPVMEAASFYSEGDEVRYRSIIVPFSSDGQVVDFLVGTTNYKRFKSDK
ncbi:MAG: PAS domain-containing protein [Rickettsiales bacterium]|nr:PAS domain-containing protein [Rickettsiales bacterium]